VGIGAAHAAENMGVRAENLLEHTAVEKTIIDSITDRRVLAFDYAGAHRTVNPHALFRAGKRKKSVLHAWQTEGVSNTRVPPCWGNFRLDRISNLTVMDETFSGGQPDFNPKVFREVIHKI
jgi:predicted DNA-binding transcriptional regulator YafY